jgi:predicted Zn-dependent peptidase
MPFHTHKLPNGLQIIGETSPSAKSVGLGFFVKTGSRDETPEVSGVSHFLEHMVFKGTPRRTAHDVNSEFDRIGADNNAFTSEENTVFYASHLPEYLPQAVDVLADILRPSLRGEDFDREKQVILEEIDMYEDQPTSVAYDRARRLYFGEHKLGNSVLGTPATIKPLTRDQMAGYFERRYIAPNITAVAAGNYDWNQFVDLIARHCGHWPTGQAPRTGISETQGTAQFELITRAKVQQEHVILMSSGPAADSPLRFAADLLAMAIGDDSGSRYYWALVDPGLAESADMGFHDYEGTGAFYSSFSCEPSDTADNLTIVRRILAEVQQKGITPEELEQARSKVLSRIVRYSERPRGRLMVLGMNWTYRREYRSMDDDLDAFKKVTLADVRTVLDRYPLTSAATLALGPLAELAH